MSVHVLHVIIILQRKDSVFTGSPQNVCSIANCYYLLVSHVNDKMILLFYYDVQSLP